MGSNGMVCVPFRTRAPAGAAWLALMTRAGGQHAMRLTCTGAGPWLEVVWSGTPQAESRATSVRVVVIHSGRMTNAPFSYEIVTLADRCTPT